MFKTRGFQLKLKANINRATFVFDVDGVLTDGTFIYDNKGKVMKRFGPHDAEAAKLMGTFFPLHFITADARGFKITQKRVSDMGFEAILLSPQERQIFVEELMLQNQAVVFVGDSFSDIPAMRSAFLSACPRDAMKAVKKAVTLPLGTAGGKGVVAEVYSLVKYCTKGVKRFAEF